MHLYNLLRSLLFKMDAEKSHHFSLHSLKALKNLNLLGNTYEQNQEFKILGLNFKNKIGLAAGLDKNGEYIDALGALGFGFIEIGTVTPKAQGGNNLPRLWRLPEYESIINRMGFNNYGVDFLIKNVKNSIWVKQGGIIGINIGKNAATSLDNALTDYLICLEKVYNYASYIVVNISSPNTNNLRDLQKGNNFLELLQGLKQKQQQLNLKYQKYVPILIKIAPDLEEQEIQDIAKNLIYFEIDGVVSSNTTIDKSSLPQDLRYEGGLSGALLKNKSDNILEKLNSYINKHIPIIGVGGIMSAEDCSNKFNLGADLVQLYSGFIYNGPKLIKDCIDITQKV